MYQLNLADKNLYASLESDTQILDSIEKSSPEWNETRFSETNLAPFIAYDNGDAPQLPVESQPVDGNMNVVITHSEPEPVQQSTQPTKVQPMQVQPMQVQPMQVQPTKVQSVKSKPKRSVWGFIKFGLIVILIALIIYFTIYRIGWGVSECAKRNYHDCAALLTPELSTLALTSIML